MDAVSDVACQYPLSVGFPGQDYWSGLPLIPLGDLSNLEIELSHPALAGGFFMTELPGKPPFCIKIILKSEAYFPKEIR